MAPRELAGPRAGLCFRLGGVPVLMFHGVSDGEDPGIPPRERKYWVGRAQLRALLRHVTEDSYRVVLLRDLWEPPANLGRGAVLTFDDGRGSDYEVVYPLLVEAGVRGEFFVNTATVGRPGFVSWAEIREMHEAGMSFQSHGHDHIDLSRLPRHALESQVRVSKQLLEDRVGCAVDFLAAPYGRLNRTLVEVAQEAGYRGVCTSWSSLARPGARTVHRVAVYRHTTSRELARLLTGDVRPYAWRALRSALLYAPARLLLHRGPSVLDGHGLTRHA